MRVWTLAFVAWAAACAFPQGNAGEAAAAAPAQSSTTSGTLAANRELFVSAVGDDYDVTFQRSCFCPPEARQPLRLEVRSGEVRSVTPTTPGAGAPPERMTAVRTVTEVFDLIQDAYDREAAAVRGDYDQTLGYPRELYIDYSERIADEEQSITLSDLVLAS